LITIYFKTTPIIIMFLEQCILPRIMPMSKCLFVFNINFVRHHSIDYLSQTKCTATVEDFRFFYENYYVNFFFKTYCFCSSYCLQLMCRIVLRTYCFCSSYCLQLMCRIVLCIFRFCSTYCLGSPNEPVAPFSAWWDASRGCERRVVVE